MGNPPQTQETHEVLRAVVSTLSGGLRQLEAFINPETMRDQLLIHIGKQQLPPSTVDAWERYRSGAGAPKIPDFAYFKSFLETRAKGRRELECRPPVTAETQSLNESSTSHQGRMPRERRDQNMSSHRVNGRQNISQRFQPYNRSMNQNRSMGINNQTYTVNRLPNTSSFQPVVCPLCSDRMVNRCSCAPSSSRLMWRKNEKLCARMAIVSAVCDLGIKFEIVISDRVSNAPMIH